MRYFVYESNTTMDVATINGDNNVNTSPLSLNEIWKSSTSRLHNREEGNVGKGFRVCIVILELDQYGICIFDTEFAKCVDVH